MGFLEQFFLNIKIERSGRIARIVSGSIPELSGAERDVLNAYTAGYILQKEAIWGAQMRRSPEWRLARFIPPVALVAEVHALSDGVAIISFKIGDNIELGDTRTRFELRNLANIVSTTYLNSKGKEGINEAIAADVKSWRKRSVRNTL